MVFIFRKAETFKCEIKLNDIHSRKRKRFPTVGSGLREKKNGKYSGTSLIVHNHIYATSVSLYDVQLLFF